MFEHQLIELKETIENLQEEKTDLVEQLQSRDRQLELIQVNSINVILKIE